MVEETSKIVFNTAKLTLSEARITSAALKDEIVLASSAFVFDEANERVALELPVSLPAGAELQVRVDFAGELTGGMMGYYRSSWDHKDDTKHYALTQFAVWVSLALVATSPS